MSLRGKCPSIGVLNTIRHRTENLFKENSKKFFVRRRDPEQVDLIYNIDDECDFIGEYRKSFGEPGEEEVEISFGRIAKCIDMDESERNYNLFMFVFQYAELEEFVHAAGINNVDEDHSERWRETLFDVVAENMEIGFVHTNPAGEEEIYDYRERNA